MLGELRAKLSELERKAVAPVFLIDSRKIDLARSCVCEKDGFLRLVLRCVSNQSCPFELGFGRGNHSGRMNFFVGEGAEFYSYEECCTQVDAAELSEDVNAFLKSRISCVQHVASGKVSYRADLLLVNGAPIVLRADGVRIPLAEGNRTEFEYEPWLPQATGQRG